MPTFDSIESLNKYIVNKAIKNAQNAFTETARMVLRDFIYKKYYKTYSPSVYQRSGDLLASAMHITATVKNGVVVSSIYMDPDRLRETTFTSGNRTYIRHAWHDKQEIINLTAGIYGNGMERFKYPLGNDYRSDYSVVPEDRIPEAEYGSYWLEFLEYISGGKGLELFKQELRKQGLDVK